MPTLRKKARILKRNSPDPIENGKELLSATCVQILASRDKFRKGSFIGWAYTIMVHLHFNELRSLKRKGGGPILYGEFSDKIGPVPKTPAVQFNSVRLQQIFALADSWTNRDRRTFHAIVEDTFEGRRQRTWEMRRALKEAEV